MGEVMMTVEFERLRQREGALRMALAALLDAQERYPDSLQGALEQGRGELRRTPLWCELDEEAEAVAAPEGPSSVTLTMDGRGVIVTLERTADGPLVQLRGKDCDLDGDTPGSYYLVAQ